jgi:hypothetical protein
VERGATPDLHVAAGGAGATILVRPKHVPMSVRESLPLVLSFAAPAFAGRGMAVAHATGRLMLAPLLRPKTESWVERYRLPNAVIAAMKR